MTVIAWDGKTLAADKQNTNGMTRTVVTKIHRVGDCLVAICGDASVGMEMLEWVRNGCNPENYPPHNRTPNEGSSVIVVKPDATVWKFENTPYPFKCEGRFLAFGCSDESALVAMDLGASAVKAVELASKYNNGCGMGIDSLELA